MDLLKWLVSGAAVAAIVWVNWYFFFAGKRATREVVATGTTTPEIPIIVKGDTTPRPGHGGATSS